MYAFQLNAIPAWGLQMSLGLRDSMELVQVQKLSPILNTHVATTEDLLLIHQIFYFNSNKKKCKWKMQLA